MPSYTDEDGGRIQYCTEEELLEFANKLREAGGADVIEAFMPSIPEDETACLLATALNFRCSVGPPAPYSHGQRWVMRLPARTSRKKAERMAAAVDCEVVEAREAYYTGSWPDRVRRTRPRYHIVLPRLIANAARAFDEASRGWTVKYRKEV